MSENISTATKINGVSVTRQPIIKTMRVVKKETLKVISCWVERSCDPKLVLDNFIPYLLDAVLMDYQVVYRGILDFLFDKYKKTH